MLKDIEEIGRLESLFLEVIDDPAKKEVLLYPICYCQLVRRENDFEVDLSKLLSCATKTFYTFRGRWQDILLELDLFQLMTPRGEVLLGKDILRLQSADGIKVSFLPEYREAFYEVYTRLLRYWTILSKVSTYSKRNTPAEAVHLSALIFNEELFVELVAYSKLQSLRFPREATFFEVVKDLSEFYLKASEKKGLDISLIEGTLPRLSNFPNPYYGINICRLRRDVETLLKDISKGRRHFILKISFTPDPNGRMGLLKDFMSRLVRKIKELGGKPWTLMSSETVFSSFTETCWRRQRGQQIPV